MEAVAVRARVGKPTLYLRWPGKAQLVLDAVLSYIDGRIVVPAKQGLREELLALTADLVRQLGGPQGLLLRAVIGGGQSDPKLLQACQENWWAPRQAALREVLGRAVARGELGPDTRPDLVAGLLYGAVLQRLLFGHSKPHRSFSAELVDLVMRALDARVSNPPAQRRNRRGN